MLEKHRRKSLRLKKLKKLRLQKKLRRKAKILLQLPQKIRAQKFVLLAVVPCRRSGKNVCSARPVSAVKADLRKVWLLPQKRQRKKPLPKAAFARIAADL